MTYCENIHRNFRITYSILLIWTNTHTDFNTSNGTLGIPVDLPKGDFAFKGKMLINNVIHPRFTTLIAFLYYFCWIFHSFL